MFFKHSFHDKSYMEAIKIQTIKQVSSEINENENEIKETELYFHGTDYDSALSILKEGFKCSMSQCGIKKLWFTTRGPLAIRHSFRGASEKGEYCVV